MHGLMKQTVHLAEYAKLLRALVLESTSAAGSGHPTSCLSCAEVGTVLFAGGFFRADPQHFLSVHSDQLLFSKGHAAPLLYALFALTGHIAREELLKLRTLQSPLEGHPVPRDLPFVSAATGSLGQGIGVGVGTALAQKKRGSSAKTWVVLGDSECAEGSVWEAVNLAGYYKLDNLVLLVDINRLGQRGETMFGHSADEYAQRFAAFGSEVIIVENGNDCEQVLNAFTSIAWNSEKPKAILFKTKKGAGISFLEDKEGWHGKALKIDELKAALQEIGEVSYGLIGSISLQARKERQVATQMIPLQLTQQEFANDLSPREAFGKSVAQYATDNTNIIVLDAETGNSTFAQLTEKSVPHQFIQTFIAEQTMVSIAAGLNKVGGYVPVVATFAAFFTRAYDQLRMSAYSDVHTVVAGTHVGVSIGEDGASQMGLEDIAMMRALYGTTVLCPSDAYSTQALFQLQLKQTGLHYLRLTRGVLPTLYTPSELFEIGGSKIVRSSDHDTITVFACGITVHEAIAASQELKKQGRHVRVIDMYSIKPIDSEVIRTACVISELLVVVEDHRTEGGLYSAICESGVVTRPIVSLAVNNFPHSSTPAQALQQAQIDRFAIIETINQILR